MNKETRTIIIAIIALLVVYTVPSLIAVMALKGAVAKEIAQGKRNEDGEPYLQPDEYSQGEFSYEELMQEDETLTSEDVTLTTEEEHTITNNEKTYYVPKGTELGSRDIARVSDWHALSFTEGPSLDIDYSLRKILCDRHLIYNDYYAASVSSSNHVIMLASGTPYELRKVPADGLYGSKNMSTLVYMDSLSPTEYTPVAVVALEFNNSDEAYSAYLRAEDAYTEAFGDSSFSYAIGNNAYSQYHTTKETIDGDSYTRVVKLCSDSNVFVILVYWSIDTNGGIDFDDCDGFDFLIESVTVEPDKDELQSAIDNGDISISISGGSSNYSNESSGLNGHGDDYDVIVNTFGKIPNNSEKFDGADYNKYHDLVTIISHLDDGNLEELYGYLFDYDYNQLLTNDDLLFAYYPDNGDFVVAPYNKYYPYTEHGKMILMFYGIEDSNREKHKEYEDDFTPLCKILCTYDNREDLVNDFDSIVEEYKYSCIDEIFIEDIPFGRLCRVPLRIDSFGDEEFYRMLEVSYSGTNEITFKFYRSKDAHTYCGTDRSQDLYDLSVGRNPYKKD